MKQMKFWTVLGILSLGITCSIAYSSTSKASSGLQSKGKLVYQDPVSQQEVIMDANDHTILKGSIDANSGQILSLKEFQAQQETLNQDLQDDIQGINDSLGGVTKFIVDPVTHKITGYTTEGGADTVFPFTDRYYEEYMVFVNSNNKAEQNLVNGILVSDDSDLLVSMTDDYLFTALKPCKVIIYHCGQTYDSTNTKLCIVNDTEVNTSTDIGSRYEYILDVGDTLYIARKLSQAYWTRNVAYLRFQPI